MRMILMRHANAGEPDPRMYPDDNVRPLNARGREEHELVAAALARMGLGISHILSSPLARAVETAEITARALGMRQGIQSLEQLGHQFTIQELCRVLREYPVGSTIAAVGHEPDLSHFASAMLAARGDLVLEMRRSGIIGLDFDGYPERGAGTLLFLVPPSWVLNLARPDGSAADRPSRCAG
jgi:phosphohistidine phosphatase